jgi:hypothetical protein
MGVLWGRGRVLGVAGRWQRISPFWQASQPQCWMRGQRGIKGRILQLPQHRARTCDSIENSPLQPRWSARRTRHGRGAPSTKISNALGTCAGLRTASTCALLPAAVTQPSARLTIPYFNRPCATRSAPLPCLSQVENSHPALVAAQPAIVPGDAKFLL